MYTWIFLWYLFLPLLKNILGTEKTPFLKIDAVVRNCQPHVVGYFRRLVGHFRRWKTGLAAIYQKKLWWFVQKGRSCAKPIYWLFIGQRQKSSPLWKRQVCVHIYIYTYMSSIFIIIYHNILTYIHIIYVYLYLYLIAHACHHSHIIDILPLSRAMM